MKANIVMRLKCVGCGLKYNIPNDETFDNFNIYYILDEGSKGGVSKPHLLCPKCTSKEG